MIRAFTLLELLFSVLIIGLSLGVVASLGLSDGNIFTPGKLGREARLLARTVESAFVASVMERRKYRIVFDQINHSYHIERIDDLSVKSGIHKFPHQFQFGKIWNVEKSETGEKINYLYFNPAGYVDNAKIVIENTRNQHKKLLEINSFTGKSVIKGFL